MRVSGARDTRRAAMDVIRRAALRAVEPSRAVRRALSLRADRLHLGTSQHRLSPIGSLRLVAAGKAAAAMASGAAEVLGERLAGGVVVTKVGHAGLVALPPCLRVLEAGHPVPDEAGERAAAAVEAELRGLSSDDSVLLLLSGGASALLADPAPPLSLADLRHTTDALLRSGASIGEVNAVRKHLSRLKGGQLARLIQPAWLGVLALSDVVGDPLDVIASGPAAPDPTTFEDAWRVLERRGLLETLETRVLDRLRLGREGVLPETPKPGDPLFARVLHVLVGSNRRAATDAAAAARRLGYQSLLLTTFLEGEAREVAKVVVALAKGARAHGDPVPAPACLLLGGETTVTVRGPGRGGRNQELALAAALALDGVGGVSIMALATDGSDGPTDATGAVVDGATAAAIRAAGVDPERALRENDSYTALEAGGALLRTGPTGTNVNDLLVVLIGA